MELLPLVKIEKELNCDKTLAEFADDTLTFNGGFFTGTIGTTYPTQYGYKDLNNAYTEMAKMYERARHEVRQVEYRVPRDFGKSLDYKVSIGVDPAQDFSHSAGTIGGYSLGSITYDEAATRYGYYGDIGVGSAQCAPKDDGTSYCGCKEFPVGQSKYYNDLYKFYVKSGKIKPRLERMDRKCCLLRDAGVKW